LLRVIGMLHAGAALPSPPTEDQQSLHAEVLRLRARVVELEGAAQGNEKTVSTVFATLAHELRSPLQSLILNVGICSDRLARAGEPAPTWLVEKLEKQGRIARRLKLLIDTFLNFGQIAAGHLQLEPEPVDLGELATDVVRRSAEDLAWARCPLTVDAPPGTTGVWDRLRIDLVICNLLSNAMKYGVGRPIAVTVGGTAESAVLRVQDHGPGIARVDQRRIFEKFTQLESSCRISGFGLGLWIVKHIVEASGGQVEVDSEPGEGAGFLVSLPRNS
jgi:signal transduction histidine kinase